MSKSENNSIHVLNKHTSQSSGINEKNKMSFITRCYNKILDYSAHPNSNRYLYIYSFLEAIFMPIPIDVMLGPIAMQKPKQAFKLSLYVTIASILGGCIGYSIGYFFSDFAKDIILWLSNQQTYDLIENYFISYGVLIVILVGFTPLPFKIFSISFGIFHVSVFTFIFFSFISRLVRFLIVAYLFAIYGDRYRIQIEKMINKLGWYILISFILIFILYKLFY